MAASTAQLGSHGTACEPSSPRAARAKLTTPTTVLVPDASAAAAQAAEKAAAEKAAAATAPTATQGARLHSIQRSKIAHAQYCQGTRQNRLKQPIFAAFSLELS